MKRSPLRKQGERWKANTEARQLIAEQAQAINLNYCELNLGGCLYNFPLAPAHRHKRAWYKGDVDKLSDYKQWIAACQNCHDRIEHDAELTEKMFMRLRGPE